MYFNEVVKSGEVRGNCWVLGKGEGCSQMGKPNAGKGLPATAQMNGVIFVAYEKGSDRGREGERSKEKRHSHSHVQKLIAQSCDDVMRRASRYFCSMRSILVLYLQYV